MPKDTFFRLSEEKRKRILDAAEQEFKHVPYGEASINKIIKAAGIPRGSFYQYFEDKADIFLYFLSIKSEKVRNDFHKDISRSGGDYFWFINLYIDRFEQLYRSGEFGRAVYPFLDEESITLLRSKTGKLFLDKMEDSLDGLFMEQMNFEQIDVDSDEEKRYFLGIVHALLGECVHKIFCNRDDIDADVIFRELRGRIHSIEKHYRKKSDASM